MKRAKIRKAIHYFIFAKKDQVKFTVYLNDFWLDRPELDN